MTLDLFRHLASSETFRRHQVRRPFFAPIQTLLAIRLYTDSYLIDHRIHDSHGQITHYVTSYLGLFLNEVFSVRG
jgi:hypothetical protein